MKRIITLLNESNFDYEVIKHEKTIHSAQEGASYFGIDIEQTAPALILSTEKGYIALIISGKKDKIDFSELGKKIGISITGLAKRDEIKKVFGFSAGEVPLLLENLQCIIDSDLLKYNYIYGGIGNKNYTLKISPKALLEFNNVIKQI